MLPLAVGAMARTRSKSAASSAAGASDRSAGASAAVESEITFDPPLGFVPDFTFKHPIFSGAAERWNRGGGSKRLLAMMRCAAGPFGGRSESIASMSPLHTLRSPRLSTTSRSEGANQRSLKMLVRYTTGICFRPPTHFSHMSHPPFPISHLLFFRFVLLEALAKCRDALSWAAGAAKEAADARRRARVNPHARANGAHGGYGGGYAASGRQLFLFAHPPISPRCRTPLFPISHIRISFF